MNTLKDRLLEAMGELGINSPKELADFCKVSEGLVSQWFSGQTKLGPKPLKAFGKTKFSLDWLTDGTLPKYRADAADGGVLVKVRPDRFRQVPVIGKGMGGLSDRGWDDAGFPTGASNEYAEIATADQNAFLAEVHEGSMAPRFNPGEYALVEPNTAPEIEDDVLVRFRNDGTSLKRLLSRRDGYVRLGSYAVAETITRKEDDIVWMYYVAHPVPRRKIKTRT